MVQIKASFDVNVDPKFQVELFAHHASLINQKQKMGAGCRCLNHLDRFGVCSFELFYYN